MDRYRIAALVLAAGLLFAAAKRRYDPTLLFRNAMWDTYFA